MTEKQFFIANGKRMVLEHKFYKGRTRLSPSQVIDLLNDKHEEIQNYEKSQKEALELIREQRKLIDDLYKQNEQLKEKNQNLKKCINEIYLISSRESIE